MEITREEWAELIDRARRGVADAQKLGEIRVALHQDGVACHNATPEDILTEIRKILGMPW